MLRSPPALRLSSAFLALVCALGQLAGSVHIAAARHVACGEHGGVVEIAAAEGRGLDEGSPVSLIGAAAKESHHEHCERCATPSARAAAAPPYLIASIAPIFGAARRLDEAVPAPIALFRLAPKNSPPAVDLVV